MTKNLFSAVVPPGDQWANIVAEFRTTQTAFGFKDHYQTTSKLAKQAPHSATLRVETDDQYLQTI